MDPRTITIDPVTARLRRVGRVARHRMRIDGDALRNGRHTDGTVTVEISRLGPPTAGAPDSFAWSADRPIALVIVRAGVDGDDVSFDVGPATSGVGRTARIGDGSGIRYVAFCYDAPIENPLPTVASVARLARAGSVTAPASRSVSPAAARSFTPTRRERRSILSLLLNTPGRQAPGGSLA